VTLETCRVLLPIKSTKSCISLVIYMIFIYQDARSHEHKTLCKESVTPERLNHAVLKFMTKTFLLYIHVLLLITAFNTLLLTTCFFLILRSVEWQFITDVSGQPIHPSSRVEQSKLILEDGTDRLSRNVGKKLPFCIVYNSKRAQILFALRRKP